MAEEVFIIVITLVSLSGFLAFTGMVIRAVNKHQDRKAERAKLPGGSDQEALQLQVEEMREQLAQLEERVDFTERVLTQTKDRDLLEH